MSSVTLENISYNFETLYSGGEIVDKILIDVEYKFNAVGNGFKLDGRLTLPNELTREEVEQKIKTILSSQV